MLQTKAVLISKNEITEQILMFPIQGPIESCAEH